MKNAQETVEHFSNKIAEDMYHLYMSGANDCRIDWNVYAEVISFVYNIPKPAVIKELHNRANLDVRR